MYEQIFSLKSNLI